MRAESGTRTTFLTTDRATFSYKNIFDVCNQHTNIGMTPLEAQRLQYRDHVFEKELRTNTTGFRREESRRDIEAAASNKLVGGDHVPDVLRRESSFHKQRTEAIAKLLSMSSK